MSYSGLPGFSWSTTQIGALLPAGWRQQLVDIAQKEAVFKILTASSVTSREESPDTETPSYTVDGEVLSRLAPWLTELYRTTFRDLAAHFAGEPVKTAEELRYGAVLNLQRGPMPYECHVDSNPVQGLLYVTTHLPGEGGELCVARNADAHSVQAVEEDCEVIHPVAGHLHFFDARRWPHYVRPLREQSAVRVVVAMNFYTAASPESARPADLDEHLFGSFS
ncbi:2OG-Fe(II) oxygenase [Actinoplanes sp. M2I2]|uniref:2OG-Fe(II) oxygenase n=1 Tax=Actinoplanes sp. M2I2 TaxID=1734444 RepID=UPI002020E27E|nr:2OG-Fe(II) oxygenase [Actinoplanes sp. M2I2]